MLESSVRASRVSKLQRLLMSNAPVQLQQRKAELQKASLVPNNFEEEDQGARKQGNQSFAHFRIPEPSITLQDSARLERPPKTTMDESAHDGVQIDDAGAMSLT